MKIGILSDTHLANITEFFTTTMKTVFEDVDMIIHAGDMTGIAVFHFLSHWELKSVRGNMDDFDLRNLLPEKRIEEVMGRRIGVIHGRGSPEGIADVVLREFQDVDVVIFGHSHVPLETKKGNVLLFNPGSFRGTYAHRGTVGIMEIDETITFRHIEV
jgi:putative phosphoesterase